MQKSDTFVATARPRVVVHCALNGLNMTNTRMYANVTNMATDNLMKRCNGATRSASLMNKSTAMRMSLRTSSTKSHQ